MRGALGLAQFAEDGQAVDFGEHEVQDDHVVLAGAGMPQAILAVGGGVHGEAGFGEALDQGGSKGGEIFHDEDTHHRHRQALREGYGQGAV